MQKHVDRQEENRNHVPPAVRRLLPAFNYLLDNFAHEISALDRLRIEWRMLRWYYPHLPTPEQAARSRRRAAAARIVARTGDGKILSAKQPRKPRPVQLLLFP